MKKNNVSAVNKDNRTATGIGRKLTLHRETLRHLTTEEIGLAAGGFAKKPETYLPLSFIRLCIPDI